MPESARGLIASAVRRTISSISGRSGRTRPRSFVSTSSRSPSAGPSAGPRGVREGGGAVEPEALRGRPIPAIDGGLRRDRVEARVELYGVEALDVEGQAVARRHPCGYQCSTKPGSTSSRFRRRSPRANYGAWRGGSGLQDLELDLRPPSRPAARFCDLLPPRLAALLPALARGAGGSRTPHAACSYPACEDPRTACRPSPRGHGP